MVYEASPIYPDEPKKFMRFNSEFLFFILEGVTWYNKHYRK
jgi:hypothetical protein